MVRYGRKNPPTWEQLQRRSKRYEIKGYKRWIDPFPTVHGTVPEKIVYAALSRRNIQFHFLNDFQISIPELEIFRKYQADFIIPAEKIIIEVNGYIWHSKPAAIESDAFKYALYEAMGYTVLVWWDYDILENVNKLFLQEPRLNRYQGDDSGADELPVVARSKVDSSQGIRTRNYRRAQRISYRKKPVQFGKKKRKVTSSYTVRIK